MREALFVLGLCAIFALIAFLGSQLPPMPWLGSGGCDHYSGPRSEICD